ncbi:MAG: AMP-binding protein [Candidatus Neomarinimicrobiota bacterium]
MTCQKSLQDRIYQAQCYGSVEPIEYMVPYPNLGTLVEGQNIKFAAEIWYHPQQLSYADLLQQINRTANWLVSRGITNHDRVCLADCPTPQAEILALAIWLTGASVLLVGPDDIPAAVKDCRPKLLIGRGEVAGINLEFISIGKTAAQYPGCAAGSPATFRHHHKAQLNDEALVCWKADRGIRLSHYNLLVNANGTLKLIPLPPKTVLQIKLPADSTAWAVLQAILPLYAGIGMSPDKGDLHIASGAAGPADFRLDFSGTGKNAPNLIRIIPEATAVTAVGENTVHMTRIETTANGKLRISGHSVMLGYTNGALNEQAFTEDGLEL